MSFHNAKRASFLTTFPTASIELETDKLASKCKFNFAYFDSGTQDFGSWNHGQLVKLLNKLKAYSNETLEYWKDQPIEKSNVLKFYEQYPAHSKFKKPKSVPHQAEWGVFRLEGAMRLAGFVLPDKYSGKQQHKSDFNFCCNTFYVVFLDKNHEFYPVTKDKKKKKK